ncbi:hypothetical protein RF55_22833 [Lasius niger]|uniref:Uncharacterized protein n=1 Tax=Lasius niger TaxID=67767 RepID=A0A0J7JWK0_LASNI|nr:hypothetical protein RF55_22833 [Lasius niger]
MKERKRKVFTTGFRPFLGPRAIHPAWVNLPSLATAGAEREGPYWPYKALSGGNWGRTSGTDGASRPAAHNRSKSHACGLADTPYMSGRGSRSSSTRPAPALAMWGSGLIDPAGPGQSSIAVHLVAKWLYRWSVAPAPFVWPLRSVPRLESGPGCPE